MSLTQAELLAFEKFEQKGWEKAADPYHHHWGMLSSQSAKALLDAAKVTAGSRVLDVATGAGYLAAAATDRGAHATGLDFSVAQVKLAKKATLRLSFMKEVLKSCHFQTVLLMLSLWALE